MSITAEIEFIEIKEVQHRTDYQLELVFNDGKKQVIDFGPFLKKSHHPEIQKYLDLTRFKQFTFESPPPPGLPSCFMVIFTGMTMIYPFLMMICIKGKFYKRRECSAQMKLLQIKLYSRWLKQIREDMELAGRTLLI